MESLFRAYGLYDHITGEATKPKVWTDRDIADRIEDLATDKLEPKELLRTSATGLPSRTNLRRSSIVCANGEHWMFEP